MGDGDTGSTLRRGAEAVVRGLREGAIPLESAPRTAGALADCARAMGGTSGAIYNIFFTAAAGDKQKSGGSEWIVRLSLPPVQSASKKGPLNNQQPP